METIDEADPSGVLALLDENVEDHQFERLQRAQIDECLPSGDVHQVLRSELQQSSSCGSNRPVSSDVDVERLGGPPWKSVMFDVESGSNTMSR